MDTYEALSHLLAARHEVEVKDLPEYTEAEDLIAADPALQAELKQLESYYADEEADLLSGIKLSDKSRKTMLKELRKATGTPAARSAIPFKLPARYAVAASILVLAAAVAAIYPKLVEKSSPEIAQTAKSNPESYDGFQQFASQIIENGFRFDHQTKKSSEAVSWLNEHAAPSPQELREQLSALPSRGCKVIDWNGRKVSLICFTTKENQVAHLFTIQRRWILPDTPLPTHQRGPSGRETLAWQDQQNAYILFAHDTDQSLADFSG